VTLARAQWSWGPTPGGVGRRQVESGLARWGLLRRPHTLGDPPATEAPFGSRLRGALAELGPVYRAFGLYLASRVDLLVAADCLELAALPSTVPPLPLAEVRERIAAELGRPVESAFAAVAVDPAESRLLVQAHRARLPDGQPVIVHLARPEPEERDLGGLMHLAAAFAAVGWSDGTFAEAVAGFRGSLREEADLRATAEALALMAVDAEGFGLVVAPVVRSELTTPRLLTVEDPGGSELAAAGAESGGDDGRAGRELARLCSVAWLHQALEGRVFPLALPEAGVRAFPSGRLAFLAGTFCRTPVAARANLRGFLVAMASREPDAACSYLLREHTREEPGASEENLRLQFRQIVPFRDGAWSASGSSLAEHLFVGARQARACGFRPRPHLAAFYRGLASVAAAARRLAPERDVLMEALQEVRVLAGLAQVREAISLPGLEQWGRSAMFLSELPRRLDDLLTTAAEGGGPTAPPSAGRRRRRGERSHLLLAASLLVLAALALLGRHFVAAGALSGRGEGIAAALFALVGGFVLWILTRAR